MLSKKVKARIRANRQRKTEYSTMMRELSEHNRSALDIVQYGLGVPAFVDEVLKNLKPEDLGLSAGALKNDGFSTAEVMNRHYGLNA